MYPRRLNRLALVGMPICLTLASGLGFGEEAGGKTAAEALAIDFATEVRPILSDKCFFCHGPDPEERHADLRLDVAPYLDANTEYVIVPGDLDSSLAWGRINDREEPMPPVDSHKTLSAEEVALIGRWIEQGAQYEDHWAYAPVVQAKAPITQDKGWSAGKIDRFLYAKMKQNGLQPSPGEEPARLLRRLYLDLTGLPPTPEQVQAYLQDPSEEAYQRTIEALLASPRFGEHWAAWWLDLVRYGDSVGYHGDQACSVWPYRDWVIKAFNENMPFDRFSRLQLAGDLLGTEDETPEEKDERLFASAYNRLARATAEGGAQQAEYRAIYAADRVSNFGEVWLASSTRCCQCHDHKYDPFTAADFYSLSAFFEDIDHPIISSQNPNPHWAPYRFLPENENQSAQVAEVRERYEAILAEHPEAGPYESWTYSRNAGPAPAHGPWAKELKEIVLERTELAKTVPIGLITRPLPEARPVRFLPRGNWQDETGAIMPPRPPEFLGGQAADEQPLNRLDLANWLFEEGNPLTARVVLNRLWSRFYGHGISGNTLDFGNQGDPPTHRELLDWLASSFVQSGWDLRHVMRLMVTSRAYRQSSEQSAERVAADPQNKWFARQSAPRMSAEVLRDQALAASGLLVERLGGPSVYPYQPPGHWDALNFPERRYPQSQGPDLYRRSVYTWVQRTFPHPAMTVFDAPSRESCTTTRPESSTPLQALALLNETLSVESARHLAQNAMHARETTEGRIEDLFSRVLLRAPSEIELTTLQKLYESQASYFEADPASATALCSIGDSEADSSFPPAELAAYTSIGRVILNLYETVTKP